MRRILPFCLILLAGCLGDLENFDCLEMGTCPEHIPEPEQYSALEQCVPGSVQELSCSCGIMTSECTDAGDFATWSGCGATGIECNPCDDPTWESDIDNMMVRLCNMCHWESGSYSGIQRWVNNGTLKSYTVRNHYIAGRDKQTLLRWIEIDTPETDCDLP